MKFILFLISIFLSAPGFTQDYKASSISPALLRGADAVLRNEETVLEVKSRGKAVFKRKFAVTVLNEAGVSKSIYKGYYDDFHKVDDLSGHLYNAAGKEIKKVKKKEVVDFSLQDNSNLMTDQRVKAHRFISRDFPYTVEYEEEILLDGLLFLPGWNPAEENMSVEHASFTLIYPADMQIRYREISFSGKFEKSSEKNEERRRWSIDNIPPPVIEPYMPAVFETRPQVLPAASQFEMDKYQGNQSTWTGLGSFISELSKDKRELPEALKQTVAGLCAGKVSNREKALVLYDYLQKNTRYVSVQLGIGGWQPFDANYVYKNKFGDCKALSNFMISMLDEAKVPARYVLVTAGKDQREVAEDFPSPLFNHVIVCVPAGADSLWLECTSQTAAGGYMGGFTGNRKALLIDDSGGHLVSTPAYKAEQNMLLRKAEGILDEAGNIKLAVSTRYTGLRQDDLHNLIRNATPADQLNYVNQMLAVPTCTVEKFEFKENMAGAIPAVDEKLSVTAPHFATITGKRLFVTPNFIERGFKQMEETERTHPIALKVAHAERDTVILRLPPGYEPESVPDDKELNTPYGNYRLTYAVTDDRIVMTRYFERKTGRFPKESITGFREFNNSIYRADRARVVYVKKG